MSAHSSNGLINICNTILSKSIDCVLRTSAGHSKDLSIYSDDGSLRCRWCQQWLVYFSIPLLFGFMHTHTHGTEKKPLVVQLIGFWILFFACQKSNCICRCSVHCNFTFDLPQIDSPRQFSIKWYSFQSIRSFHVFRSAIQAPIICSLHYCCMPCTFAFALASHSKCAACFADAYITFGTQINRANFSSKKKKNDKNVFRSSVWILQHSGDDEITAPVRSFNSSLEHIILRNFVYA